MAAQSSDFLLKNTLLYYRKLYYRKLYFTTDNFTTWNVFFLQNLCQLKFFYHSKINNFIYFDINWCTRVWIKHKINIFKWLQIDFIED